MLEEIKKDENGYYAIRYFDGTKGVPECTFYLSMKGDWNYNNLTKDCYFPSHKIAIAFLRLRLKYEYAKGVLDSFEADNKRRVKTLKENLKNLKNL